MNFSLYTFLIWVPTHRRELSDISTPAARFSNAEWISFAPLHLRVDPDEQLVYTEKEIIPMMS